MNALFKKAFDVLVLLVFRFDFTPGGSEFVLWIDALG